MKTLLVTGGTGGLGTTVVERLSRDYRCILLTREPGGESSIQADLGDEASVCAAVAAAVTRFGAPYGLVHMAGGYAGGVLSQTTTEAWQSIVGLNLTSSFFVLRETMKVMKRDEPGRIVAISSIATLSRSAGAAAYQISKGGLNTLIQLAAAELARTAITANALLPDTLDTPASRKAMPDARRVPLASVAETIAFLLSEGAANISGALIPLPA
jgi:NAD(P)-dependent dehydrogenase (short-subunit alcohol dehydrogenase family)